MTLAVSIFDGEGAVRPMHEIEAEVIGHVLKLCAGNMTESARLLQIGRSTIYRRIGRDRLEQMHAEWDALALADGATPTTENGTK